MEEHYTTPTKKNRKGLFILGGLVLAGIGILGLLLPLLAFFFIMPTRAVTRTDVNPVVVYGNAPEVPAAPAAPEVPEMPAFPGLVSEAELQAWEIEMEAWADEFEASMDADSAGWEADMERWEAEMELWAADMEQRFDNEALVFTDTRRSYTRTSTVAFSNLLGLALLGIGGYMLFRRQQPDDDTSGDPPTRILTGPAADVAGDK